MLWEFKQGAAMSRYVGEKKPSITGATRLETQPTTVGLKAGLQAALADPLWLLSRQWQFNEFQGEDAGTPLNLRFAVEGHAVDAFRPGAGAAADWQPLGARAGERLGSAPLEARIEAEAVWAGHARLRGEAGLHALRLAPTAALRTALLAAFPLVLPPPADAQADAPGLLWSTLLDAATVDAAALAAALRPLDDGAGSLTALPAALGAVGFADDTPAVRSALGGWLAWFDELVFEGPADGSPAWQRQKMEYAFALRGGGVVLAADEYTDGHVDWDDFRARPDADEPPVDGEAPLPPPPRRFEVASRHPSPVRYPGMPAERYWEFEDGQVNFAGVEAGVTDLVHMSVTEFALTFGNDWFSVPVRLPVGALYRVAEFRVVDTFGVPDDVDPIADLNRDAPWTMYEISAVDGARRPSLRNTMLLPDSVDGVHEGAVLEQTFLVRDEMANLAWAIEKTVQGTSGEPFDRDLEARRLSFQQKIDFPEGAGTPQLVYRLATPVPANWTPLLPVRPRPGVVDPDNPLAIQLERAGIKRFYPEASVEVLGSADPDYAAFLDALDENVNFIRRFAIDEHLRGYTFFPRGWLLRRDPNQPMPDDDVLRIDEEEVPRIGARLKRKFQYARTRDGRSWLWVGRSKTAGRGEAASGLRFDVAVKREAGR